MKSKKEISKNIAENLGNDLDFIKIIDGYLKANDIRGVSLFGGQHSSYADIPPDNLYVLVNLFKPIRKMGRIAPAPKTLNIKGLHENLRFCFYPVRYSKPGLIEREDDGTVKVEGRRPMSLITHRRGIWLVMEEVGNIGRKQIDEIQNHFNRLVFRMMYPPDDAKKKSVVYFEQFDSRYPSEREWKQGKLIPRKQRKPKRKVQPPLSNLETIDTMVVTKKAKLEDGGEEETEEHEDSNFWESIFGKDILSTEVDNLLDESDRSDGSMSSKKLLEWENSFYEESNQLF